MNNKQIPIFYACDDAFVKYTIVSLSSMIKNASKEYKYKVYVLHTDISEEMKRAQDEMRAIAEGVDAQVRQAAYADNAHLLE